MLEYLLVVFGEHWGSLASVVGAFFTVLFSASAKRSSEAARIASEATRQKLITVDTLTEVGRLLGRVDDLLNRLEQKTWVLVVERATDLRVSVAAILQSTQNTFSKDIEERLGEAVVQLKAIAEGADRHLQNDKKEPDIARYRKIVTDQKETLTLASQELKTQIGDAE